MPSAATRMEQREARVLERVGDRLRVCIEPGIGCARCAAGEGCGQGLVGAMRGASGPVELWVTLPAEENAEPGGTVMLAMPPERLLGGSALIYLAPLAGLLVGALSARFMAPGVEWMTVLAGVSGLVAAFALTRQWLGRHDRNGLFEPSVVGTGSASGSPGT